MKLYKTPAAAPGERWHSSKTGLKDLIEVELPKEGRGGMAAFLNTNETEVTDEQLGRYNWTKPLGGDPTVVALDPLEAAELRAVATAQSQAVGQSRDWEASDIEDFILNRARTAQVESIFARLGTRFKELTHGSQ